jgi:hypothetical protein
LAAGAGTVGLGTVSATTIIVDCVVCKAASLDGVGPEGLTGTGAEVSTGRAFINLAGLVVLGLPGSGIEDCGFSPWLVVWRLGPRDSGRLARANRLPMLFFKPIRLLGALTRPVWMTGRSAGMYFSNRLPQLGGCVSSSTGSDGLVMPCREEERGGRGAGFRQT